MNTDFDILIIGGGAAGFFTACNVASELPKAKIGILERGKEVLSKVKVSGGGRCNVTHAEFTPSELVKNYPRGEKELLGPFHTFMTGDTMEWFESRGVPLKIEEDGRIFPVSDSSQSIIDCLTREAEKNGVEILLGHSVQSITKSDGFFQVNTSKNSFSAQYLVVCTGSNPKIWKLMEGLGHIIIPPVPSLFTFNIGDKRLADLAGVSTAATVHIQFKEKGAGLFASGPLLVTHWGMSGPAILKLSAWGARELASEKYCFQIVVNWLDAITKEEVETALKPLRNAIGKKRVSKNAQFHLPKRLWEYLVETSGIPENRIWAELTKSELESLVKALTQSEFEVEGKSTFKEEFVTAGGVDLKEVNFKTFESKIVPGMYLAGEVLNIDAITGGFNFQNAWTGGYMVAKALGEVLGG